jgi:hypothetical protein
MLAFWGGFAPARAADVVSSNIVGYEKVNLSKNTYFLSGSQFVKVGGGAGTLNDLFAGADIPFDTEVLTLNASGSYDHFYYLEEAYDAVSDDFIQGWGDGSEEYVTDPIPPGTGFWVKAPADYSLTQAGEVVSSDSITIDVPAGQLVMIANPFPEGFNPNAVTWSANLPYDTEIMTLNASGSYDHFYYLEEAYDAVSDDFIPGWGNGSEEYVTENIASFGQGIWIQSTEAISLTITK